MCGLHHNPTGESNGKTSTRIDGTETLASSQNWSDTAIATNREAGVILDSPVIAKDFATIFATDWETGVKQPIKTPVPHFAPRSIR